MSIKSLYEKLLEPSQALIESIANLEGDIIILGAGGKMGPSLAKLAKNAIDVAGVNKRVIAVARFSEAGLEQDLQRNGIETRQADLLDDYALQSLPDRVPLKMGLTHEDMRLLAADLGRINPKFESAFVQKILEADAKFGVIFAAPR